MREALLEFDTLVIAKDGTAYRAVACGSPARDGTHRWHGCIEFAPVTGGRVIRTPRETTQRDRADTAMWATGLTPVYLEGALRRALDSGLLASQASSHYPDPGAARPQGHRQRRHRVHTPLPAAEPARRSTRSRARASATGFARVGGMGDLKTQIRRIVETVHLRREDARRYGIVRNGILLYGPPGCGKSFFVQAMAEEFGLQLVRVPLASAITKYVGGAPDAIQRLFEEARSRTPCVLFFDEFDAIACRRQDTPLLHEQQMVNALLEQLDTHRETPGLLIVAATNRSEDLDPAVIRQGRFDYKVQVANPDFDGRLAILHTLIDERPHDRGLDLAGFAHNLEGFSAAQLRSLVDEAALMALEGGQPIRDAHLHAAYQAHVTASRYGGVRLGWGDLILPADIKRKLQLFEQMIENPQLVRQLGITPSTGLLLSGPPGTGKTSVARVLASETEAGFLAVNAADIFSKWLGESEQHVKDLFARARAQVPAMIFIDEIDAIAERRGGADSAGDRVRNAVVNMFLAEMDGLDALTRVSVIGATNRPELLDEALLRPGRLGERIEIPLPDADGRKAMLELFTRKMHLDRSVDLERVVAVTNGASGALLKGLCAVAGRNALVRELDARGIAPVATELLPAVTQGDFERALKELSSASRRRPIGFGDAIQAE